MSRRGWGCELARLGCGPVRPGIVSRRKLDSLPFRLFHAVWVEISGRHHWESLPFRLFSTVWVEISGRPLLDSLPFRPIFVIWVEISNKQAWDSLPFSADFPDLGRDFQPAALGFSTLFGCFPLFG